MIASYVRLRRRHLVQIFDLPVYKLFRAFTFGFQF